MLSNSEFGRNTLVGELASPRFDPFKKLVFEYYIDGLELLHEDRTEALSNIAATINRMADFQEKHINPSHYIDA
jgi:hypothetical protein